MAKSYYCCLIFKGYNCGYEGKESSCDKTLANCTRLGNERNFIGGGLISSPSKDLRDEISAQRLSMEIEFNERKKYRDPKQPS